MRRPGARRGSRRKDEAAKAVRAFARAVWVGALVLGGAPGALLCAAPLEDPPAEEASTELSEEEAGITLLDGRVVRGAIARIESSSVYLASGDAAIPFYEIKELRFAGGTNERRELPSDLAKRWSRSPIVRFTSGETLGARVLLATGGVARVRLEDGVELALPLDTLRGFRLREAHAEDSLFEEDLRESAPSKDTVYARRGTALLRVEGVFQELTADVLVMERNGAPGRMPRRLVQGVLLAPVASVATQADPPASADLGTAGRIPVYLTGVDLEGASPSLLVRFPGHDASAAANVQRVPLRMVESVHFASDRVVFLSSLEPTVVEETAVAGRALPHRRDHSVSGKPLRLGGRTYRRGLGVHSRCRLEYTLGGKYRVFAAVIGLDDGAGADGSVTFRVVADGKELYSKDFDHGQKPATLSLPVEGVERLGLEVDYGSDGLDVGDHADWADARVTR